MFDNILFSNSFWLILTIASALEGYFKPIDNLLAHLSATLKIRKQRQEEENLRYIAELVEDNHFFLMETVRVSALGIMTFIFIVTVYFLLPLQPPSLLRDLEILCGGILSIWMVVKVTPNLNLLKQAREYYREDKQIEVALGPDFDETAYLSKSSANVEALERGIRQYETGQHVTLDLEP
jgi:hypothetical protein